MFHRITVKANNIQARGVVLEYRISINFEQHGYDFKALKNV
jgi:hypothetical protein